MGYYIFSFGIEFEKIKSTFSSKDEVLFESIKNKYINSSGNSDFFEGRETTPEVALRHIINGEEYDQDAGYAYGYALIYLCESLGHKLPFSNEIKFGYETDFINEYLDEDFDIRHVEIEMELLARNHNIFKLPRIDDWPLIGLLKENNLLELKTIFKNISISDELVDELEREDGDESKIYAYKYIKGIIQNIDFCLANKLDLISFCH